MKIPVAPSPELLTQGRHSPAAVVVGLCLHGLATVRALAKQGIRVHAIEQNRELPGDRTRFATVHFVRDINGNGLVDSLIDLQPAITGTGTEKPVLFLMNDNMVLLVASRWQELKNYYRISWESSIDCVSHLLIKSNLEQYCNARNLDYPKSWILHTPDDLNQSRNQLSFPMIVKPVRPLGGFKVAIVETFEELDKLTNHHQGDYPLLIQQWIAGDDTHLFMCALYLDEGREIARFCARKMLSHPPALGRTTAAESYEEDSVYRFTSKFFEGLRLSGPVSLELKRDDTGRLWIIEPTLGRTDFWLGLCIAGNVNFPYIEYCNVAGIPVTAPQKTSKSYWFDTEVDPTGFFRFAISRGLTGRLGNVMLPFFDLNDIRPFYRSIQRLLNRKISGRSAA